MYRFLAKPRWILFTLLIVALMVTMVNLGFWQIRRLHQREAFNSEVIARSKVTALDVAQANLDDVARLDWTNAAAVGTYLQKVDHVRVSGGYQVVSPLTLTNGTIVLVVRGFTTVERDLPAPPPGTVRIPGYLRAEPTKATRPALDGAQHGLVLTSTLTNDGDLTPVALPVLDNGPHLSYAIQWFIFTVCAGVGWGLVVRRQTKPKDPKDSKAKKFDKHQAVPWRDEAYNGSGPMS